MQYTSSYVAERGEEKKRGERTGPATPGLTHTSYNLTATAGAVQGKNAAAATAAAAAVTSAVAVTPG